MVHDPYVVRSQPNTDIPVYVVGKEHGSATEKVLHRNLLLPFSSLPTTEETPHRRMEGRRSVARTIPRPATEEDLDSSESDEDVDDDVYVIPQLRVGRRGRLSPRRRMQPNEADSALSETRSAEESTESRRLPEVPTPDAHIPDNFEESDGTRMSSRGIESSDESVAASIADTEDATHQRSGASLPEPDAGQEPDNPVVRRSGRERRQPAWMRTGAYAM